MSTFSVGQRRHEVVRRGAGQVDEPLVVPLLIGIAGVAGHDVGVDVDGIDRVAARR